MEKQVKCGFVICKRQKLCSGDGLSAQQTPLTPNICSEELCWVCEHNKDRYDRDTESRQDQMAERCKHWLEEDARG